MQYRIIQYETIVSTNDLLHEMGQNGAEEGTVVVAEFQEKGRGRYQREWQCKRGKGLLFSILLRPKCHINETPILTQEIALSIDRVFQQEFNLNCKHKAPNDLLIKNKKVCGILTEGFSKGNAVDHVVLGVGINVTATKKELLAAATSLSLHTKKKINKKQLLDQILKEFNEAYEKAIKTTHTHTIGY